MTTRTPAAGSGSPGTEDLAGLVDTYGDRVFRFLLGMTGDVEMAEDLTQETFLKMAQAGSDLAAVRSPVSYVFVAARHTAISSLRRRSLEKRLVSSVPAEDLEPLGGGGTDPRRELERAEIRAALAGALAELPERLREVFLLSEVERLGYAEIAEILGCSPGTVGSRKHHAMRTLRRILRREGHELR